MATIPYIATGLGLVVLFLAHARLTYGKTLVISTFFVVGYFVHAFIAPTVRISTGGSLHVASWPIMTQFNIACLVAFLAGLVIAGFHYSVDQSRERPLYPVFTPQSYNLLSYGLVLILITAMVLLMSAGAFTSGRSLASGYGPKPFAYSTARFLVSSVVAVMAVSLAYFLCDFAIRHNRTARLLNIAAVILLLIVEVGTFGRKSMFAVFFTLLIFMAVRMGRLKRTNYLYIVLVLAAVSGIAMLRSLGLGFSDISADEISYAVGTGTLDPGKALMFLSNSIPGQEVLSNVIPLMDYQPPFLGSTYLINFVDKLTFNMLPWSDQVTPAIWYARTLNLGGYGRDFSMLAEAYMNFGSYGWIVFFLFGVLFAKLNKLSLESTSFLWTLWACYMGVNFVVGLRNDSLPLITRALFSFLPLLLYLWAYRFATGRSR